MDREDIISRSASAEQRDKGANYALRTLPWTFNRMNANTSPAGQNSRALNISKGVVAQSLFLQIMKELGANPVEEDKSHRSPDLFDLRLRHGSSEIAVDFKSFSVYTNYKIPDRPEFSIGYLLENQNYDGPEWARFFPLLVPHTQIQQDTKDAFVFALSESQDFRKLNLAGDYGVSKFAVFPWGSWLPFLTSSKLALLREGSQQEMHLKIEINGSNFSSDDQLVFVGESKGKSVSYRISAEEGTQFVGPFSLLSSIYTEEIGTVRRLVELRVEVEDQGYADKVLNSAKRNINQAPEGALSFTSKDFCNLTLPEDYTLHFLGWITKEEFRDASIRRNPWVWPKDSVDKMKNQAWSTFSDRDKKDLGKIYHDGVFRGGVGALKTTGLGNGAACYFYPNMYGGGVREMNFYCLPSDLWSVKSLGGRLDG